MQRKTKWRLKTISGRPRASQGKKRILAIVQAGWVEARRLLQAAGIANANPKASACQLTLLGSMG
jgi:hypothetical protein